MKKALSLFLAMAFAASTFAVEVGKPAPDLTGTDINGKTVHLSDFKGKIVVIESYNSDCPFCNNHYKTGAMPELQKDFATNGVAWLIVNSVNPNHPSHRTHAQAQAEMKDKNITANAWIDDSDGKIGHLYDMQTTPQMFVINKDGTLVYDGAIDDKADPFHNPKTARNYVKEAVN